MSKMESEVTVKELINIIQTSDNAFDKESAMLKILEMFNPFRRALTRKFASKGVDFDDVCQVIDLKLIEAMYDYDESLDNSAIRHITSKARNGIFNFYKKEMNYFREDRRTISLDIGYDVEKNGYVDKYRETMYGYVEMDNNSDDGFDEDKIIEKIMIEQGLDSLTNHQKDLIFMYYMSDMSQKEIASELQINQANVSRATKRGVKKLRESFNPLGENDDKF